MGIELNNPDPFDRQVFCIQGIPIDALMMRDVVQEIETAVLERRRLFLSTPNLNFLIQAQSNEQFRQTIVSSDINIADGVPLLWIARILRLPIRQRLAGSDLLDALAEHSKSSRKLINVGFFGGVEGAGENACKAINEDPGPVRCVGFVYPGFKSIDELSTPEVIDEVNRMGADFLIVALGAVKGQLWLHRNIKHLSSPVRSHLGALINMKAGLIKRAPSSWQRLGVEWVWRIKEEPTLWRRYWYDGWGLIRLLLTRVVPLALLLRRQARRAAFHPLKVKMKHFDREKSVVDLGGIATDDDLDSVRDIFRTLDTSRHNVVLDMASFVGAGPGFFGLLLVLSHQLSLSGRALEIISVSQDMRRCFRLNGVDHLLCGEI